MKEVSLMGVGVVGGDTPLTATRAVVRFEDCEVAESKFRDSRDREQKQFAGSLKVLNGAGERNGEVIREWLSFPATGEIGRNTKCGQVVTAALGENVRAETLEELADMLVGKRFVCEIGTSRDGKHSRVVHDTIGPAPGRDERDGSVGEEDIDDLPW
jgi:hypothetical protein